MTNLIVQFAVYGALKDGNENESQAYDVRQTLQAVFNAAPSGSDGIVKIDNNTMGGDPSPGNKKHFAAIVTHDGVTANFACEEGQTIDFHHSLAPNPPNKAEEPA
ncbi:hypothetical protein RMQ97_00470 [Maricaulis sp. D1M11]|uniref:hypothetical protein n=1 Tax=Maricaulis sp. D1M11 TaxID=3076117 RepID=UPI0039B68AFE